MGPVRDRWLGALCYPPKNKGTFIMAYLFLFLLFLSPVALIFGLIRPSEFSRFLGRFATRKSIALIFGGATIIFFILFGLTLNQKNPVEQQVQQTSNQEIPAQPVKSDEQILEERLGGIANRGYGSLSVSYRSINVENSGPDRPAGTKMITVKLFLSSFWSKESLYSNTGKLSSEVFQAAYSSNLSLQDAIIWYSAEVTDRYGNKKDDVVLTYAMDKSTHDKINWANFDRDKLCEFLRKEQSPNFGTACNTLVKIE